MDQVYQYKQQLIDYIYSISNDSEKIVITLEDLLYMILSDNPKDDEHLKNIVAKLTSAFNNNKATSQVSSLKKIIDYTNISGLNEEINTRIYDLLLIDQIIKSNINVLNEEFDEKLNEMNNNLKNSYDIEKENLLNLIR